MSVNNSLVCHPIEKFGTDAQKEEWLIPLAQGKKLGCYCLSEPGSGSDAAAMKTRAVKKNGKWILNGVKNFITNGREADLAVVYAIVDPEAKHKGIGAFLVPATSKGYSVGKVEDKLGICGSSTTQIILENVELPESAMIGREGEGFKIAMSGLDGGRINIASCSLGGAAFCLDAAKEYIKTRKQFGKHLADFQHLQFKLAEMSTNLQVSRNITRSAANAIDSDSPDKTVYSAMAKSFATENCFNIVSDALQMHGGYGYLKEYQIERYFRDLRVHMILEGTNEIMKLIISRNILSSN
jgi:alkylation response protein AidB-like acyl-CoA dehydrogenase